VGSKRLEKFGLIERGEASPETYLQATVGSQRHFSLVKDSRQAQLQNAAVMDSDLKLIEVYIQPRKATSANTHLFLI
jgi:hypothetical protein